jgi:hypothetical protein
MLLTELFTGSMMWPSFAVLGVLVILQAGCWRYPEFKDRFLCMTSLSPYALLFLLVSVLLLQHVGFYVGPVVFVGTLIKGWVDRVHRDTPVPWGPAGGSTSWASPSSASKWERIEAGIFSDDD